MAREPDSLAFRFAVVTALAMGILTLVTLASPPKVASNLASPYSPTEVVYRPQHLNLH
jgi:hypothetical protein